MTAGHALGHTAQPQGGSGRQDPPYTVNLNWRLAVAVAATVAVLMAAPVIGQIRGAIQDALPGQYRAILIGIVLLAVGQGDEDDQADAGGGLEDSVFVERDEEIGRENRATSLR
jgi:hypothetical protein